METPIKKATTAKVAERTISLTVKQIKRLKETPELCDLITSQIEQSEGNLKGNMAFAIAEGILKQQKLNV